MSNKKLFYLTTLITYIVTIFSFVADQVSKQLIANHFELPRDIILFGSTVTADLTREYTLALGQSNIIWDWLWLTYVVNHGAAFSSFDGQTTLLSLFAATISLGLIVYERMSYKTRTKLLSFSMGFLLGGALGNLIDRARLGYVVDFLDLRYHGENIWPIFNVADISINIGIGLLILYYLFQDPDKKKKKEESKEPVINTEKSVEENNVES